ncbi:hypothetical protein QVD17_03142 [Tagetes erecta]|uniref:Uncharacterized protein n=1 Tax=Tagetes erecta TaxID=13708 RepID=A0AAD8LE12_TARER|nr:hypothetical protein QVD17_03142 [Tagetes erecta]
MLVPSTLGFIMLKNIYIYICKKKKERKKEKEKKKRKKKRKKEIERAWNSLHIKAEENGVKHKNCNLGRWSTLLGRWSTPRPTKNGFLGVLRSFLRIFEGVTKGESAGVSRGRK